MARKRSLSRSTSSSNDGELVPIWSMPTKSLLSCQRDRRLRYGRSTVCKRFLSRAKAKHIKITFLVIAQFMQCAPQTSQNRASRPKRDCGITSVTIAFDAKQAS